MRSESVVRWSRLALVGMLALLLGSLSGCTSTTSGDFEEMPTAEQLFQEGEELLANHRSFLTVDLTDYTAAIQKFQDIIDNYPYSDLVADAELKIADAFFQQESWEEALTYFRDFAELHPDHPAVPYALLQAARCHRHQSRAPGRDQTATRDALNQLDAVITRFPYSSEATEAEALWKDLRTRLGTHVMGIGDYYFERGEHQSAANRYRSVLNEYPGLGLDADALYKLGVCYQNLNRNDKATQIFEVLLENYDGSDVARAAQDLLPAAN
ncbi:MAG: outer membrane protein assembly factor BamD [bacterium]|nr:outer membrane protein assembly factor BamD [bacterium]